MAVNAGYGGGRSVGGLSVRRSLRIRTLHGPVEERNEEEAMVVKRRPRERSGYADHETTIRVDYTVPSDIIWYGGHDPPKPFTADQLLRADRLEVTISPEAGTTVWRLYQGPRTIAVRRADSVFEPSPPSPTHRNWWDYGHGTDPDDEAIQPEIDELIRRRRRQFWTWFIIGFIVKFFVSLFSS